MTIRMQESEAAENFSRFLAHLKAGDQVQLEADGRLTLVTSLDSRKEPGPGDLEFILRKQQEFRDKYGPLVVEEGYSEHMREAHEEFNQPWEPRTSWD